MIKNILKSKLFVLCSMLFCSLAASVFFFGTSSKAVSLDELKQYFVNENIVISDAYVESLRNAYYTNHSNYDFAVAYTYAKNGSSNVAYIMLYPITYYDGLTYSSGQWLYNNSESYGQVWFSYSCSYSAPTITINSSTSSAYNQYGIGISSYYQGHDIRHGSYNFVPPIDWNNPYYSANIPNPNIYVSYRNLNNTPVIDVPLNVSVSSFPVGQNVSEYYVQMFALVNMDFNYYVQNTRDGIVYNGLDMERWTTYFDVVLPQDYKTASDLSEDYIHLKLTDGWYNNYPQDSNFSFSFADGIPSTLQSSAITKFNNFRKNATFADNTVYIYVRYFTIDQDNNFVVGSWTVWKSYNPNEFYAELPSYYVPYNIVPGTQGTNSNVTPVSTASPEPSVIVNPVNTNPSVNVTVTQNVPNYPDYPTIASYNKDNLLVDTINQLGSIQTFFGEFGSFLVTAFAFMPAWIWAIIGVGFSLSIVVMFLKIL